MNNEENEKEKLTSKIKDQITKKKAILEKIFAGVFVVWFIASMVGMIIFAEKGNTSIACILFGQYFFVFAMVMLFNIDEVSVAFAHLTVGIIIMLAPFITKAWPRLTDMNKGQWIEVSKPIIAIILGYAFLIMSRKNKKEHKKFYIISVLFFVYGIIKMILFCL